MRTKCRQQIQPTMMLAAARVKILPCTAAPSGFIAAFHEGVDWVEHATLGWKIQHDFLSRKSLVNDLQFTMEFIRSAVPCAASRASRVTSEENNREHR